MQIWSDWPRGCRPSRPDPKYLRWAPADGLVPFVQVPGVGYMFGAPNDWPLHTTRRVSRVRMRTVPT